MYVHCDNMMYVCIKLYIILGTLIGANDKSMPYFAFNFTIKIIRFKTNRFNCNIFILAKRNSKESYTYTYLCNNTFQIPSHQKVLNIKYCSNLFVTNCNE